MNPTGLKLLIGGMIGCSKWQESKKRKRRLKKQMELQKPTRKITITID